ncbi:DNA primase [Candidatus Micrarchaeota archaeon]|nr:DNA primase [Candidatus Micrarchaeota archaeon]
MGKTYIDTVKYVVNATIEIDGVVEKPDVVGALFGQTEGLLGDELDLRELQKSGRIGRIEVDLKIRNGKTLGEVFLPSSLDRVETAILAAALETVDRVGPCEANVKVLKIEDTRTAKRAQVVNRAKNILRSMITDTTPESKELSELVRDEVKVAEVKEFGRSHLACGPNIEEADHLIVVEGRADVITLLKCDIRNVIAMQGKNVPPEIVELSKQKTITAFVDGDRGGDLAARQLAEVAEVDFIAKAPDGKEVEELTKKEIIKCLRSKMPFDEFISRTFGRGAPQQQPQQERMPAPVEQERPQQVIHAPPEPQRQERPPQQRRRDYGEVVVQEPVTAGAPAEDDRRYEDPINSLKGTLKAVLLNQSGERVMETDVRNLLREMREQQNVDGVVFDGIVTQRLVDVAAEKGIKTVVGVKQGRIANPGSVRVLTLE